MNEDPLFHIYSGPDGKDAVWIEALPGLASARERIQEIASQKSGRYFVISPHSSATIAVVDTSKKSRQPDIR